MAEFQKPASLNPTGINKFNPRPSLTPNSQGHGGGNEAHKESLLLRIKIERLRKQIENIQNGLEKEKLKTEYAQCLARWNKLNW